MEPKYENEIKVNFFSCQGHGTDLNDFPWQMDYTEFEFEQKLGMLLLAFRLKFKNKGSIEFYDFKGLNLIGFN